MTTQQRQHLEFAVNAANRRRAYRAGQSKEGFERIAAFEKTLRELRVPQVRWKMGPYEFIWTRAYTDAGQLRRGDYSHIDPDTAILWAQYEDDILRALTIELERGA